MNVMKIMRVSKWSEGHWLWFKASQLLPLFIMEGGKEKKGRSKRASKVIIMIIILINVKERRARMSKQGMDPDGLFTVFKYRRGR